MTHVSWYLEGRLSLGQVSIKTMSCFILANQKSVPKLASRVKFLENILLAAASPGGGVRVKCLRSLDSKSPSVLEPMESCWKMAKKLLKLQDQPSHSAGSLLKSLWKWQLKFAKVSGKFCHLIGVAEVPWEY